MTTNINILLKAVDQASGTIKSVAATADTSLSKMKDANIKVEKSSKDVALAFNNVATSGFALYNAIDRVQDMQVSVDRANLAVKTSLNAVEDAQRRYNTSVEKYGAASENAQAAAKDLQLAQERYQVACERADMMQGNLNEAMIQSAITVIPSLITMITSVSTLTKGWTSITQGISGAMSFLAANPIILVVAGIAALIAGLIWAYQNCEPFRNAINAIANVLSGAFFAAINAVKGALEYVWNNVLVPFGNFLTNVLLAAWQGLCKGWEVAYNTILKPIFDGIAWFYNNIIKPVADFFGGIAKAIGDWWGGVTGGGASTPGAGGPSPRLQAGGIVTKPTFGLLGEAGPEAVIPLANLSGLFQRQSPVEITIPQSTSEVTVEINAPMVYVNGAADKQTARMCASLIKDALKNVVIEATSVNAPTGQSQIRIGSSTSIFSASKVGGLYNWNRYGKMGGPQP